MTEKNSSTCGELVDPASAISLPTVIFGDVMWYLEQPASQLPKRNRTSVISTESAVLGGSAINVATHLCRLGAKPLILSVIASADEPCIHRLLSERGLDAGGLSSYEGHSNCLAAFVGTKAARSIFLRPSVPLDAYERLARKFKAGSACVYLGSRDGNFRRSILERLVDQKNAFIFAPSYSIFEHSADELRDFARQAEVAIMNHHEFRCFARALGGQAAALQLTKRCIVTRAAKGAIVYAEGKREIIESQSRSDKDIIGAGDAFLAGFLMSWLGTPDRNPFLAAKEAAGAAARFVDRQANKLG